MVPKAPLVPGVGSFRVKHSLFRALGPVTCYIGYQDVLGVLAIGRGFCDSVIASCGFLSVPSWLNTNTCDPKP